MSPEDAEHVARLKKDAGQDLDPELVVAVAEAIALDLGDCSALGGQAQMSSGWNIYRHWAVVALRAAEEHEAGKP